MVGQQRPSSTEKALAKLHEAEQKILSSLNSASKAFRSLSTATTTSNSDFSTHAAAFLKDLHAAQELMRGRIAHIGPDLPFENVTMRRLIEADLAVQRTAHVHRSLVRTLAALDETPAVGSLSGAASPTWMPSPVASTPLVSLGGTAPSPSPAGAPITVAVPSPDAAGVGVPLSAAVALNGGVAPAPAEGDGEQAEGAAALAEQDSGERMEL